MLTEDREADCSVFLQGCCQGNNLESEKVEETQNCVDVEQNFHCISFSTFSSVDYSASKILSDLNQQLSLVC